MARTCTLLAVANQLLFCSFRILFRITVWMVFKARRMRVGLQGAALALHCACCVLPMKLKAVVCIQGTSFVLGTRAVVLWQP